MSLNLFLFLLLLLLLLCTDLSRKVRNDELIFRDPGSSSKHGLRSVTESSNDSVRQELTKSPSFGPQNSINPSLRHLITRMLTKNPLNRPSLQWVKEHDWITAEGTEPMPVYVDHAALHEEEESSDYSGEDEDDETINCHAFDENLDAGTAAGASTDANADANANDDFGLGASIVQIEDISSNSDNSSSNSDSDSDSDDGEIVDFFDDDAAAADMLTTVGGDTTTTGTGASIVVQKKRASVGKSRRKSFSGVTTIECSSNDERKRWIDQLQNTLLASTAPDNDAPHVSHLEQGTPVYQEDRIYVDSGKFFTHHSILSYYFFDMSTILYLRDLTTSLYQSLSLYTNTLFFYYSKQRWRTERVWYF